MFETWIETELNRLPTVTKLMGRAFTQDNGANKVGVILKRDGEPEDVEAEDVKGFVILPDGTMINDISGDSDGNRAWIVLPSSAYAQQGQITVAIRLEDSGDLTTIGVLETYVYPTT